MKKKLLSVLFCLIVITALAMPISAATVCVHDYANILTTEQEAQLSQMAQELQDAHSIEAVLLTTPELYGKPAQEFADAFYENNGYAEDGILFLVDMGSRQWHISTSGFAIDLLSDRDLMEIEDQVIPYLSESRYYEGFQRYLELLPKYLAADTGTGINFFISLLAGAGIAAATVLIMRSSMNTKRAQRSAANYEIEDSYRLHQQQDLFLYSNVTKRPKPKNNTSSGSSTHRSASGKRHGGRGGSF